MKISDYKVGDIVSVRCPNTGKVACGEIIYIDKTNFDDKPFLVIPDEEWLESMADTAPLFTFSGDDYWLDDEYDSLIKEFGQSCFVSWPKQNRFIEESLEELIFTLGKEIK